jgi:hypothetical protein
LLDPRGCAPPSFVPICSTTWARCVTGPSDPCERARVHRVRRPTWARSHATTGGRTRKCRVEPKSHLAVTDPRPTSAWPAQRPSCRAPDGLCRSRDAPWLVWTARTDLRDRPGARLPHTTHHAEAVTQTPVEILWVCGSEVPILDRRAHPAQRSGCRAPDGLRRSRDRAVTRVDSRAPTGMANTARLPDTIHRADAGARAPVGTWSWLPRTARQQLHPDDFARISLGHHRSQSTMLVRIAFELIHPSHDVGTARPTWVRSSELRPDLSDPRL